MSKPTEATTTDTDIKAVQPGPEEVQKLLTKLLLELGPLVVYFVVNSQAGIFWGTGCFIVATVAALVCAILLQGTVPKIPLVSCVFVLVFGSLTLWLHDDFYIKMKPTLLNSLFAAILFSGLAMGKSWIKYLFGEAFHLTDEGWRILTFRWGCFFVVLAILNEIVWRNSSTDFWISFKMIGILPLTMIFAVAQIGLLKKHEASAS